MEAHNHARGFANGDNGANGTATRKYLYMERELVSCELIPISFTNDSNILIAILSYIKRRRRLGEIWDNHQRCFDLRDGEIRGTAFALKAMTDIRQWRTVGPQRPTSRTY